MKVAVIGCGKQAPKHISGLKSAGITEIYITDVVRENVDRLAKSDPTLKPVYNVEEIFLDATIGAVSICTPTASHGELIQRAIKSNKHFLCEKPLCENIDEARSLAQACADAKLIGMVGYVYRFVPAFETAHKILGDSAKTGFSPIIGRVTNAYLRIGGRGSHALWKHQKSTGGGAINEMMVHMVDLAQWLFGQPIEVQMLKCEQRWQTREIDGRIHEVDAEDWTLASLKTSADIEVIIQSDFITPAFTQYIEIQGENGSFFGSIQPDMPSFVFCVEPRGEYYSGKTDLQNSHVNLFEAQMGTFVNAVQNNVTPDRGTIYDALAVMETIEHLKK